MEILEKYHPVFWFYSSERYFPCNMKDYISNCSLQYKGQTIVPYGKLTAGMITDPKINTLLGPPYTRNSDFVLVMENEDFKIGNKEFIQGYKSTGLNKYPVPVFAYVNHVESDFESYTDVVLMMLYAFNGTRESHTFDSEFVTVRYDNKANDLYGIYMSEHGGGRWVPKSELEMYTDPKTKKQYPVVYIANESHATYPHAGKYPRIFNFGSDFCNKGFFWSPQKYVILPKDKESLPEEYKYLAFVGNRSQDQDTGFPPYYQQTPIHSLNYDCPDDQKAMIEKSLGKGGYNKLMLSLNIIMLICLFLGICGTVFAVYAETFKSRTILIVLSFVLYTIAITIAVLSFTLGYTIFDTGFSWSGTQ